MNRTLTVKECLSSDVPFWDRSCFIALSGLEHPSLLLPQPPGCWYNSHVPPCPFTRPGDWRFSNVSIILTIKGLRLRQSPLALSLSKGAIFSRLNLAHHSFVVCWSGRSHNKLRTWQDGEYYSLHQGLRRQRTLWASIEHWRWHGTLRQRCISWKEIKFWRFGVQILLPTRKHFPVFKILNINSPELG